MIAPTAPTPAPIFTVVNPAAEPSDAWLRAIAVLLLADVDAERARYQEMEKPRDCDHTRRGPWRRRVGV